jgi:hypothetical protein
MGFFVGVQGCELPLDVPQQSCEHTDESFYFLLEFSNYADYESSGRMDGLLFLLYL